MTRRLFCTMLCGLTVSLFAGGCASWNKQASHTAAKPLHDDELRESELADHSRRFPDHKNPVDDIMQASETSDAGSNTSPGIAGENDYLLGRQAENAGQFQRAQQYYSAVIRNHPTHAHAHHRLGVVADKLEQYAAAKRHYQSALHYLSPENHHERSIVLSDLGYSLLLQGDFPASEKALKDSLKSNNQSRLAWRNLGLLYGYRGDYQQAFQAFTQAGGEADARSKLDSIFPQWRENQSPHIAGRPNPPAQSGGQFNTTPTNSSTSTFPAAPMMITQAGGNDVEWGGQFPAQSSVFPDQQTPVVSADTPLETFPSSQTSHSHQYPTQAQLNKQTELQSQQQPGLHSSRNFGSPVTASTPPLTPESFPDNPAISRTEGSIQAPSPAGLAEPLAQQQPSPQQRPIHQMSRELMSENGPTDSSARAQATLRKATPRQIPPLSEAQTQSTGAVQLIAAQDKSADSQTRLSDRQTALLWGDAIGSGFLFPTTRVNSSRIVTASRTAVMESESNPIQQASAKSLHAAETVDPIDKFDAELQIRQRELREQQHWQQMLKRQSTTNSTSDAR